MHSPWRHSRIVDGLVLQKAFRSACREHQPPQRGWCPDECPCRCFSSLTRALPPSKRSAVNFDSMTQPPQSLSYGTKSRVVFSCRPIAGTYKREECVGQRVGAWRPKGALPRCRNLGSLPAPLWFYLLEPYRAVPKDLTNQGMELGSRKLLNMK